MAHYVLILLFSGSTGGYSHYRLSVRLRFFGLRWPISAMGKQTAICFGFCVHGGIND